MENATAKVQVVSEAPKTETKTKYAEYPFDYEVLVNGNIIAKRNFKMNNYIQGSMQSIDFKYKVDDIVKMIDDDLKSKSRIFTAYYEDWPEFANEKRLEPWECTFEFRVYENKKLVISKIWDGSGYPRQIREKVDLTNKFVKITGKDGKTYSFDKNEYFEENPDKITSEMYVLREMIIDKPDLLYIITKSICEACSQQEGATTKISDYDFTLKYGDKTYTTNIDAANEKLANEWRKATEAKNKDYFKGFSRAKKTVKVVKE